jgi:hypothetical protein
VTGLLLGIVLMTAAADEHRFSVSVAGEAVATIRGSCDPCDWSMPGQEAVVARVSVDGTYSQHLLISRGSAPAEYRVLLGPLTAGEHRLAIERDAARSAKNAGALRVSQVDVRTYAANAPEHAWLSQAPFIHARPGTMERFSDLPILAWVERAPAPGVGFRYSIIFSHEDGGTPTDRLMATWGRTTDIEFVFGAERTADGVLHEEIQGRNHDILRFGGRRLGAHPLLWVSTDNNMVSDTGPEDAVRFGLAPDLVALENVSREVVMDRNPWTYAVMSAELRREGRIDPAGQPGSARIPDPRRFAYLEACGQLQDATLAFDVGVSTAAGQIEWHPSDRGEPRFRIVRSGCFRAAVPLPEGVMAEQITGMRLRAYTRPRRDIEPILPAGTGRVTLQRFNGVFMLDHSYRPGTVRLPFAGVIEARGEAPPVPVPAPPSVDRSR